MLAAVGNVVATPHRRAEVLADLFIDPVSENRKLAIELVIDADDLLPNTRRYVTAPDEMAAAVGSREDPAVSAARVQK